MVGISKRTPAQATCQPIDIGLSPEFTYGCTDASGISVPARWHVCFLTAVMHNDNNADSDFTKRVETMPGDIPDAQQRRAWRVVNLCPADSLGSGIRCLNLF